MMKPTIILPLAAALWAQATLHSETMAWWRLDESAPPIAATEGGPDLKWWSETRNEYASSESAPPSALYRLGATPAARSFSPATSCLDAPGGLFASSPTPFTGDLATGLTVEGFFSTQRVKREHENQAIITCGDGWLDASWAVGLIDGRLVFSVFRDDDSHPVTQVQIDADLRDEAWHYFVARILPSVPGRAARLSLSVTSESGMPDPQEISIPEGTAIRQHTKAPIIGRSSLYIDAKDGYKGTWDTFQGALCDIRISSGIPAEGELLGRIRR